MSGRRITITLYECRCKVAGCKWFHRGYVVEGVDPGPIAEKALKRHLLDKHEITNPRVKRVGKKGP